MKVGDYVRFYNRSWTEIGQIIDEVEDSHLKVVKCKDGYYNLDNFVKSSPNIIDLIEVGDYVNGNRVDFINNNNKLSYEDKCIGFYDGDGDITLFEKDIKTIVTREMFESMEYKVGD